MTYAGILLTTLHTVACLGYH